MVYHKTKLQCQKDRGQRKEKVKWPFSRATPNVPSPICPTAPYAPTHYASSSHVPDQISCGGLIPIIVRKLEEGLVLCPTPGGSFPQFSGPARLLELAVVRGGGRGITAVMIVGGE